MPALFIEDSLQMPGSPQGCLVPLCVFYKGIKNRPNSSLVFYRSSFLGVDVVLYLEEVTRIFIATG